MRESNKNRIELLEITKNNDILSALVRQSLNQENLKVRFAINMADYNHLKRILDYRPFENTGFGPYRYYFVLNYRKDTGSSDLCYTDIRVEQLDRHKQYEFKISQKLMSDILWLYAVKDMKEIETMIEK